MSLRTAVRIGAATLAGVAGWLLWQTEVPGGLELPRVELDAPRAEEYARLPRWLWVGRTAAELLLLGALAAWWRPRWRYGTAVLLVVLGGWWLVRLPFGLVLHWWQRRYGLSDQGYVAWVLDPWLELLAFATAAVVLLWLFRRLGRRWWLAGGALAAVGAAFVLIQPLVLRPQLEPLRIGGVDVSVRKMAERTTRINAEVRGGEVILWDTLLDGRVPPAEIRFLVEHELAHVARHHVWKGIAWFALLAVPIAFVIAKGVRRSVPLAVLTAFAVQLALLPFANAVSRRYEAEADWVALRATGDPAAARALLERFVDTNLADPSPPAWSRIVLGTHPSIEERIARTYSSSSSR